MGQSDRQMQVFEDHLRSFRPMAAPPLPRRRRAARVIGAIVCVVALAAAALLLQQLWPGGNAVPEQTRETIVRDRQESDAPATDKARFPTLLSLRMRANDDRELMRCLETPPMRVARRAGPTLTALLRLLTQMGEDQ